MRLLAVAVALCALAGCATSSALPARAPGYIVYTQHRGADGGFWYRTEAGPMSEADCRAALKKITTRSVVGFTKWYDVTMPLLEKHFGHPAVPTFGSWVACWAEGTKLGEPDS